MKKGIRLLFTIITPNEVGVRMENITKHWRRVVRREDEKMRECGRAKVKGHSRHMGALKTNGESKQAQRTNEMKPA